MTLMDICIDIAKVENGLADGNIVFRYDSLMSAMKPGHPADLLDDILTEIGTELCYDPTAKIPLEKVEEMYQNLKEFKRTFGIEQLDKPVKDLGRYISDQKK